MNVFVLYVFIFIWFVKFFNQKKKLISLQYETWFFYLIQLIKKNIQFPSTKYLFFGKLYIRECFIFFFVKWIWRWISRDGKTRWFVCISCQYENCAVVLCDANFFDGPIKNNRSGGTIRKWSEGKTVWKKFSAHTAPGQRCHKYSTKTRLFIFSYVYNDRNVSL